MDQTYQNLLKKYLTDPGSYTGSTGYTFARDQGLDAASRGAAAMGMRGSGNLLAELTKLGTGYASADYGSTIDRLGKLTGQEEQYGLGEETNRLTGLRDAGSLALGTEANRLTGLRDAGSLALGHEANANTAQNNRWNYDLGGSRIAADYDLGTRAADTADRRTGYDYDLGRERNSIDASTAQNNFNIANGRNAIDWYNAGTSRGSARSNADLGQSSEDRAWYSIYPRQRVAGQP